MYACLKEIIVFGFLYFIIHHCKVEACQDESFCSDISSFWCSEEQVESWCPELCGTCVATTSATTTATSESCTDDSEFCPEWESFCDASPWMLDNCKKTCGVCGSDSGPSWTSCTKTCGVGTRYKETCTSGQCQREYEACNTSPCRNATCGTGRHMKKGIPHACCNDASENACGVPSGDVYVSGGVNAKVKMWPWMVALLKWFGNIHTALCGGTLISSRFVLTAAHCFTGSTSVWKAHTGLLRITDARKNTGIRFSSLRKHGDFTPGNPHNDIAVIRLAKRVPTTVLTKPVCLPGGEVTPKDTTCYVVGWGRSQHSFRPTNHLQEGAVMNYDTKVCSNAYSSISDFEETISLLDAGTGFLCAGSMHNLVNACQGDSGSPLVCQRCSSCQWYVAGIVSFGHSVCGSHEVPAVYVKVLDYETWIESITRQPRQNGYCRPGSVGP